MKVISIDFSKVETATKPQQTEKRRLTWLNSEPFSNTLWMSLDGTIWDISEMSNRHARNVQKFILSRASGIQEAVVQWYEVMIWNTHSEQVQDMVENIVDEIIDMDARTWLKSTPSYRALVEKLYHEDSPHYPGEDETPGLQWDQGGVWP